MFAHPEWKLEKNLNIQSGPIFPGKHEYDRRFTYTRSDLRVIMVKREISQFPILPAQNVSQKII